MTAPPSFLRGVRRWWDLLAAVAAATAIWLYVPLEHAGLRAAVTLAGFLLGLRIARSLKLLLQLTLWLLDETFVRPSAWTIVGGLTGAAWLVDLAWRLADGRPSGRFVLAAVALGYPAGALLALLPRGLVHGFASLRRRLAEHARPEPGTGNAERGTQGER